MKANTLYDLGLRTIEDLERYYDVPATDPTTSELQSLDILTPNGRVVPPTKAVPDLPIKVALTLRKEFDMKIPREEVEQMHAAVMQQLANIQPGCISMIVGG